MACKAASGQGGFVRDAGRSGPAAALPARLRRLGL